MIYFFFYCMLESKIKKEKNIINIGASHLLIISYIFYKQNQIHLICLKGLQIP